MATAYHRLARETPEYAWWKLPVAGLLAFVFFMMAIGALLLVALVGMYAVRLDGGDRIAEWFDAATLVDVDRPDFFALDMLGIAVMTPALLLAVLITGPRPNGYMTSVTGRMRWSWLGHTSVLATAVFGGGIAALVAVSFWIDPDSVQAPSAIHGSVVVMLVLVVVLHRSRPRPRSTSSAATSCSWSDRGRGSPGSRSWCPC